MGQAGSEPAMYKNRQRRTHNTAQATPQGECLNFNAAPEPRKGRSLTRLLTAFPNSYTIPGLALNTQATKSQGWPRKRLQSLLMRSGPFILFFQKRLTITCAPKGVLEYPVPNGRWKRLGGSSRQHWNTYYQVPGRAESLNPLGLR